MADNDFDFKRILVGVDDSDDAILAFHYAIHRAIETNAELIIASVLEGDDVNVYQALTEDFVHGKIDDLRNHIKKYQEQAKKAGVKHVQALVAEGAAGETIVRDVIPHVRPDLLVVGSRAKKGISKRFGSQAAYMAKYSPVSVMVIR
ncbi:universal stress protein UspA [Philodulcilactobacillus myokoensis]|uniref:Universal stress protein UspA n=1 Tax=Philodulcilactobacillus myokoensis TaxID=2929573 RepID=A0A9W6ERJ8_9LACO|nr:universal stress protein [Philodulcilactobacillus myokoensis]GLB46431.1 universal stress protein UspA [Philodulcilactobacillus myokoensis]